MASFSSSAFSTDAFSSSAFDFGGFIPPVVVTPEENPTGGWSEGKRKPDVYFAPRKWSVRTDSGTKEFDTAEEAREYLEAREEQKPRVKRVIELGKAFPVYYADRLVADYSLGTDSGAMVFQEMNAKRIRILERLIEQSIENEAQEELDMFLICAAIS